MFNILITFILWYLSRLTSKPTKWHVRPAKTHVNLDIRPVWSESLLSTWGKRRSLAVIRAHSEASDQTGRLPRLIWVFAGRKVHFIAFVMRRLILLCLICVSNTDFCYFEAFYFLKLSEEARIFIYPCTCMLVSVILQTSSNTFIFHDGRRVSLFI